MRRGLALAVLLVALTACGEGETPGSDETNLGDLRAGIEDGDSCAVLIGIKNAMDPKSADYEAAPDMLRSVGCSFADSERTDQ